MLHTCIQMGNSPIYSQGNHLGV